MADVVITVLDNGPLLVKGPVEVMDAVGNRFDTQAQTALCRCGQSRKKPFCDGTHKTVGFADCARAKQV